jgi:cell division protein FtsA
LWIVASMAKDRLVVGIDVGSTKICSMIARITEDEQLEVIGAGVTRSEMLRKGVITNIDQAAQDIQNAVQKAEQQSGFKILSAYVSISGPHLQTEPVRGSVSLRRPERPISDDDVFRVLEVARVTSLSPEREVVDVVPRHYSVDGQEEIASPIGMHGSRLEVEATLISSTKSAIQSLTSCVERAGIQIDALVPQSIASAEAVLTPAERSQGVLLIDLGGGTTDLAIFADNALIYSSTIPAGGYHVSNDIALRLRTPFSAAEEIKLRYGQAYSNERDEDRTIDVSTFDSGESVPVSLRIVSETIEDRLVEILELARKRLDRAGFDTALPAGAVLVGGTAQLKGIRRLAAEILDTPVRVGLPGGLAGLGEPVSSPAYASSVGLLRWGQRHGEEGPPGQGTGVKGALNGLLAWLRGFLP